MARVSKFQPIRQAQPSVNLWRAALYVRLSREDGDRPESESILSQKLLLEDFVCRRMDLQVVDTYVDDGYSGTNFERDGFKRMFEDILSGRVNCVVVKDLSRFGRNYVETGKYLEVIFPTLKTRFISVNDHVDSVEDPASAGSVIIPFKNIINDEYCRDISQKVRSSLTIKRKQGQFIGSFAAYGYQKDPENHNKLIIDEEAAEVVRLIFDLFVGGKSILGIARHLNSVNIKNITEYKRGKGLNCRPGGRTETSGLWSDYTIRRILTNRVYLGDLVQKKTETVSYKVRVSRSTQEDDRIVVCGTHEAIVSREMFEKAQALMKRDTRISPISGELGLFAGFIKCADCRRAMQKKSITQPNKKYDYFICSTYKKMPNSTCTKHTIRQDILENAVLRVIQKYIEIAVDMDELLEQINKSGEAKAAGRVRAAIESNKKQLKEAEGIMLDLYPDFKSGLIEKEQYLSLKERYAAQILHIKNTLEGLNADLKKEQDGVVSDFTLGLKRYKNLTKLSREVLSELVNNIYIHEGGSIEIDFNFKDAYEDALEYIESNKRLIKLPAAKNLEKVLSRKTAT